MIQTQWKHYLMQQAERHPSMEPRDVFKMIFQAAFGAEHLLKDKEAAYAYFQKEYESVLPKEEPLYEQIGAKVYRVNLSGWKKRKLPSEWLFRMFVGSVEKQADNKDGKQQTFWQYVEEAEAAVFEGVFSFSHQEFTQYTGEYKKAGLRAVHHSDCYRVAEKPAYRLVSGEYIRILPVLEAMADMMQQPAESDGINSIPSIITIDGRCASGKSTMASMLSEIAGASVVHMDDFFLPSELRTAERLAQPGGNVHYERFGAEVLPQLKKNGAFNYRRFDCSRMQLGESSEVEDSFFRIVEGAYCNHPSFGEYADLKVFSDVEEEEQLRRIAKRDGEESLSMFKERWIPMEEKYLTTYRIKESADIIV